MAPGERTGASASLLATPVRVPESQDLLESANDRGQFSDPVLVLALVDAGQALVEVTQFDLRAIGDLLSLGAMRCAEAVVLSVDLGRVGDLRDLGLILVGLVQVIQGILAAVGPAIGIVLEI